MAMPSSPGSTRSAGGLSRPGAVPRAAWPLRWPRDAPDFHLASGRKRSSYGTTSSTQYSITATEQPKRPKASSSP